MDKERKAQVDELERYVQAVRDARAALAAAEKELETYLQKTGSSCPDGMKEQDFPVEHIPEKFSGSVIYDERHGCLLDREGRWILTLD
ncbi:MAG: hypothetical protein IJ088_07520 [Clostridia bacterium]|nr:hypothetical protein [Clostridia bacterium]